MRNFLIFVSIFSVSTFANAATCNDLKGCAKVMFDLFGQRYVWDGQLESNNKLVAPSDVELTKENGEQVFTALLDQLQMARAPVGDGKTFRVLPGAHRKEMNTPILDASFDSAPTFPSTWDWVTLRYKMKAKESTVIFESMYRLHMPRHGRMQADLANGTLIVTGPAPTVKHMYELVKGADVPAGPEVKKQFEETREWQREMRGGNMGGGMRDKKRFKRGKGREDKTPPPPPANVSN